ncbi:MAG: alpha-2-macroglobulin family protein [Bacteriovoracaceae bacterium]|nr:alpha-2-macroglobulin family protein [Bacteriovoracaceae bacterium]
MKMEFCKKMTTGILYLLSLFFFGAYSIFEVIAASDQELSILLTRPNAENVSDVRQISVTFNKTMVPLGDYEKLAKDFNIDITPKIDCQWRWLNGSTIACELNQSLPPSNAYKINIPAGIKSLDGSVLKKSVVETFSTLHWDVVNTEVEWMAADQPKINLTFNQPINFQSLQENTSSACGKLIVSKMIAAKDVDPERSYSIQFEKPLGLNRSCSLHIKDSLKSLSGKIPSKHFNYSFRTYAEFKITYVNGLNVANNPPTDPKTISIFGVNPDKGIDIGFTVPTNGKNLSGKIKVDPFFGWTAGGEGSPEHYMQYPDQEYFSLRFQGPMQGASKHIINLVGLKDKFGRPLQNQDQILVTTTDFPPILQLPDGYGVVEKFGPHQLGFSGVNAKDVKLDFFQSQNIKELKIWDSYNHCNQYNPRFNRPFPFKDRLKHFLLTTNAEKNIPFSSPIDFSQIDPSFKYGIFIGKMESATDLNSNPFKAHRVCSNFFSVVTDIGLMAKVGFYSSGIWAHSLKTGQPIGGIKVGFYTDTATLFEGTTDNNGYLEAPGAQKWDPERSKFGGWGDTENLYVAAQSKDDFSMLPFEEGKRGIDYYSFAQSSDPLKESTNYIAQAITDRPLYKPGQKINIKIFARHWEPLNFGLRPTKEIVIEILDSLYQKIYSKNVKLSEFGTANFSFDLDASTPLGSYTINAKIGTFEKMVGMFDVQVFTLPSFKLTVTSPKKFYSVGESANFSTAVRYHFGGPVTHAKGEYSLNFIPGSWRPILPKWQSFIFDNNLDFQISGYEAPRSFSPILIAKQEVKTDKNGDANTEILLPSDQIKSYGKIEFGINFKDDKGKGIATLNKMDVFYTQFLVGIRTPKWAYETNEGLTPEVILLNHEENPVPNVDVTLKLINRTYETVRRHGEGNFFYYETKTKDKEMGSCTFKSSVTPSGCSLKPKVAGDYHILAIAKDAKGRITKSSIQKYVTGKEYIGWFRENHDRIDVIADKSKYTVGETAKILIKNPYQEVDALITIERFGIIKQFRKKLKTSSEIIEIPLTEKNMAPGFYVSIQLIKGRVSEKLEGGLDLGKPSFKMGLTKINVTDPDTVLKVESKSDQEQYAPGKEVKVAVKVSSSGGNEESEISVAVVDEKILQQAGDYEDRYQLHDKFYDLNGGDVVTSQMLSHIVGRRHFGKKGSPSGGDGDTPSDIRKNILPLAYWNPAIRTNSNGQSEFKFTLPDNVTTWRILVVAVDKKHRFGFGSSTFIASKKIMIEPALPSFLTEGDTLNARFAVFNRSGLSDDIKSNLKVKDLILDGASAKTLSIENQNKTFFEWKVKTPFGKTNAQFELTSQAVKSNDSDGIIETVPIYPFASYETFANYGSTTNSKITENLLIPQGIRPELSGLEIMLSPSLITHLDDAFRYLFFYPYQCWEQTLDRSIALSFYMKMKQYLSIPEINKDPKNWSTELVNLMPKFQYENGAMAYWKPEARTTDEYLTVFTGLGLIWLKESGITVPEKAEEQLLNYIRNLVNQTHVPQNQNRQNDKTFATLAAIANYVLSEHGDNVISNLNKLFADRKNLSLFGKSFLWMAAAKYKETKPLMESLKKEIYSSANLTAGSIQFQELNDDGLVQILNSTTRTNCNLLEAMLQDDPKGKLIEPLVKWIINKRKSNHWDNTQENLYCIHALAHYARIFEKDVPNYKVAGYALNQKIHGATFKNYKDAPQTEKFNFKLNPIGTKTTLELEKKGTGRLYYTARLKIAYQEVRSNAVNSGMQVERNYYLKSNDGKWVKPSQTTKTNLIKLKRGQLVKVNLKVTIPANRFQVVLDDRLPAGLGPLNTALATTSVEDARSEQIKTSGNYFWNEDDDWYRFYANGGFYHREMYLHSVQYFAKYLPKGEYQIDYIAQAIATGEFNANPAIVEQMYEPEVYGKSAPAQFFIED